ncbi:chemotaxis protein CheD [Desulfamplus magnetovallimortis]|nr:chemotaxis protein CheD [Desulfamplus magnetovallimortis]
MAEKPVAISTVLGSSVSVCIFDKKQKIGGMNHFQFPEALKSDDPTARYGNVATLALVRMMKSSGSKNRHLVAQIFGGAYNPELSQHNIGTRNINAARNILNRLNIKIISEDVGGEIGRKIVFNTSNCEIAILKVPNLRQSDWYPYESDR